MKTYVSDIFLDNGVDLNHYYGEWHVSDRLEKFLDKNISRNVRITIEVLDDVTEEMVTVTYKELLRRADDASLNQLGVDPYYLNEGGDPTAIMDIPKSIAKTFMNSEEFNARKHDENT